MPQYPEHMSHPTPSPTDLRRMPSLGGSGIEFLRQWQVDAPIAPWSLSVELTGVYLLVMIPSRVRVDDVRALIPAGFTAPVAPDGTCRNILSFGLQQYVRPMWSPKSISFTYLECISGLPGLTRDGQSGAQRYSTMLKLYLDSWVATVLGELIGLPKVRSEVRSQAEGMEVRTREGQPLIRAEFTPRGPVMNPGDSPFWAPYGEMFEQVNVSRLFIGPLIGTTVRFSLEDALMQSVSARVTSEGETLPGLKPGENRFPGIDEDPVNGALQLRLPWRMSWPKLMG